MMKSKDNGTVRTRPKQAFHIPKNISDSGEQVSIQFLLPGYQRDEIEIAFEDGFLYLSANITEDEKKYLHREFSKNSFERKFKLPNRVDTSTISANMKDGILSLQMEKIKPKKIDIQIQ